MSARVKWNSKSPMSLRTSLILSKRVLDVSGIFSFDMSLSHPHCFYGMAITEPPISFILQILVVQQSIPLFFGALCAGASSSSYTKLGSV